MKATETVGRESIVGGRWGVSRTNTDTREFANQRKLCVIISKGSYVDMTTSLMTVVHNKSALRHEGFEKDLSSVVDINQCNPMVCSCTHLHINSTFDDGSKSVTVHAKINKQPASKLLPDMFVTGVIE